MKPNDTHLIIHNKDSIARDVYVTKEKMEKLFSIYQFNFVDFFNSKDVKILTLTSNDIDYLESIFHSFQTYNKFNKNLEDAHTSAVTFILSRLIKKYDEEKQLNCPPYLQKILFKYPLYDALKYNVNDLIKISNYSYGYFSRGFKKTMGYTLKEYLLKVKFDYAVSLLENSNKPCSEISEIIGFHTPTGFIKSFKKLYGITPNQYRKQVRNK